MTPELLRIQKMLKQILLLAGAELYLTLDGHFGNNNALQMVLACNLQLVSKLRQDSALYFSYTGSDKRHKYGDKISYTNIPAQYLKETTTQDGFRTDCYQVRIIMHFRINENSQNLFSAIPNFGMVQIHAKAPLQFNEQKKPL